MKIAAFTLWSKEKASSRLRSFYLFYYADQYGIEIIRPTSLLEAVTADILHLQKLVGWREWWIAMVFRLLGRKVVFDFDDQAFGRRVAVGMYANFLIANYITTDTAARKEFWEKRVPFREIHVLPDILDVPPGTLCFPKVRILSSCRRRLSWVGDASNLHSIEPLIHRLKDMADASITIATNSSAIDALRVRFPWVCWVPWEIDIVFDARFQGTAMILNHGTDPDARLKSENKMVLAIAAGLVPIVSRTQAYETLALKLNASRLVFDDVARSIDVLELLDQEWVADFFLRAREFIADEYSAAAVLRKFLRMVDADASVH